MDNLIPFLTLEDKINAVDIYQDKRPAIIVEGSTDLFVYEKVFTKLNLDWHEIDLVVAGGKPSLLKHHNAGINFDYIALLDLDYERIKGTCLQDERIIYTHFYTFENYITSLEIIAKVIDLYATIRDNPIDPDLLLKDIFESIKPFSMLCLKKMNESWGIKLEDIGLEKWDYRTDLKLNLEKLEEYVLSELRKINIDIENLNWVELEKELDEAFANGLEYNNFVSGKRIFDALYYKIEEKYPTFMKSRNKSLFKKDLVSFIFENNLIDELVQSIGSACLNHFESKVLIS
ncbi:DUF4435 domain-containing protein [Priestia flexa]|uniref:DUF4435 domain-containing protein n=1 Tax=Priestia flexa TaxID=86664 RepID=UPI00249071E8|nr:DUF4435 domain-containing protein [Priestia flexa]